MREETLQIKENKMLNWPVIKWHAQELHKLLVQEPNNPKTYKFCLALALFTSRFISGLPTLSITGKAQSSCEVFRARFLLFSGEFPE